MFNLYEAKNNKSNNYNKIEIRLVLEVFRMSIYIAMVLWLKVDKGVTVACRSTFYFFCLACITFLCKYKGVVAIKALKKESVNVLLHTFHMSSTSKTEIVVS